MFDYPAIDPVLLSLGPLKIHWYGLMYLVGFTGAWALGRWRAGRAGAIWTPEQVDDIIFYGALGVILGGRLGYVLFYGFGQLLADPLYLFRVWDGGMSFHGGLLGVLAAMYLYARKLGRPFFVLTDFIAPLVPVGLFAGRIGNFINGELWGKVTDSAWGMRIPCGRFPYLCRDLPPETFWSLPHHPSQLYQAALEGLALFLLLWLFSARPRPTMAVSGLFLIGYGVFRFGAEFVRSPDAHIGYLAWGWLTMGQLLTVPMLLFGVLLMFLAYRKPQPQATGLPR